MESPWLCPERRRRLLDISARHRHRFVAQHFASPCCCAHKWKCFSKYGPKVSAPNWKEFSIVLEMAFSIPTLASAEMIPSESVLSSGRTTGSRKLWQSVMGTEIRYLFVFSGALSTHLEFYNIFVETLFIYDFAVASYLFHTDFTISP